MREDSESEDEAKQEKQHRVFMVNISKRNESVASGTVAIDEEEPCFRKVLTLLPKEFRVQGLTAITTEIDTPVDLEVFEWVTLPPGGKTIPCRLVEKVKYKGDGPFVKVKMRCVVEGYMQKPGKDFGVVCYPTAMISSIRIFLAVAVTRGRNIFELDVKNAYCHGTMDRECYIGLPPEIALSDPGLSGMGMRALKLCADGYGTHQGGRLWFHRYKRELVELNGF
jgi:hypothetical protein